MPSLTTPNHNLHHPKPATTSLKTRPPPATAHTTHPPSPPPPLHLQTSRHNPDFRARNQLKILQIGTVLSNLQLHLHRAKQTENQAALDDVHARALKVSRGLENLAEGETELMKPPGCEDEEGVGEMLRIDRPGDWYCVRHGRAEEEGVEYEGICAERIGSARRGYEQDLKGRSSGAGILGEGTGDIERGCAGETGEETQDVSGDTTLLEDDEDEKSGSLSVSADVEGLSVLEDRDAVGSERAMFLE